MAEHRLRPAETDGRDQTLEVSLENEEDQLAAEFRAVLRDLAVELAETIAEPSVGGVAQAVRAELGQVAGDIQAGLTQGLTSLREHSAARVEAALAEGMASLRADLAGRIDAQLDPISRQMDRLASLEVALREASSSSEAAIARAVESLAAQVREQNQTGRDLRDLLVATSAELSAQAGDLRSSIGGHLPAVEAAVRNLSSSQDHLRAMLRTYGESLERSLTALETKFAELLAANLERASQRQAELETRMRATADRTEEAVVDLMQGNQAHHQAMVEGTAASLSQLEMFAESQRRTASAIRGLFYLTSGAIAGLVYVSYLLLARG